MRWHKHKITKVSFVHKRFLGGCDIFIHTASSSGTGGTGDWQGTLDMDIMGAVHGVETLTPHLAESSTGSIVFMSSTAALETFIAPQAFNALKAALITYGSQLSQALAPQGDSGETCALAADPAPCGAAFGGVDVGGAQELRVLPVHIRRPVLGLVSIPGGHRLEVVGRIEARHQSLIGIEVAQGHG